MDLCFIPRDELSVHPDGVGGSQFHCVAPIRGNGECSGRDGVGRGADKLKLSLDALRLECEHLAIGVGLRALEREPAPPGPQLAASRDLGLVGGHSVVDSSYSVFHCPSGRLVIIDREVAAPCIRRSAARSGKQRVSGAQVEGEATYPADPVRR